MFQRILLALRRRLQALRRHASFENIRIGYLASGATHTLTVDLLIRGIEPKVRRLEVTEHFYILGDIITARLSKLVLSYPDRRANGGLIGLGWYTAASLDYSILELFSFFGEMHGVELVVQHYFPLSDAIDAPMSEEDLRILAEELDALFAYSIELDGEKLRPRAIACDLVCSRSLPAFRAGLRLLHVMSNGAVPRAEWLYIKKELTDDHCPRG